jgi:hypothetical protein
MVRLIDPMVKTSLCMVKDMFQLCIPLLRKYSPLAHLEYGARNCRGAGSEAVAAARMEYPKALASELCFYVHSLHRHNTLFNS